MKMENLEFIEAVEFIAKKFNINLEYEEGGPSREEISLRKQLFDLHELVTDWFHRCLMESDEAAPVRSYWEEQRGFSLDTAKDFKIGYAPARVDALAKLCEKKNIPTSVLHAAGLFFARDGEQTHSRFKSRFRGRLMIPIRDVQSRVVAFTARQLPQNPTTIPPARRNTSTPRRPRFSTKAASSSASITRAPTSRRATASSWSKVSSTPSAAGPSA